MTATSIRIAVATVIVAFLAVVAWLTSSPKASVLAFVLIAALWGYILLNAVLAAIAIYAPEHNSFVEIRLGPFLARYNPSKIQTLGYVAFSYALTIYLFAIIFRTISNFDENAFKPAIDTLGAAIYFSIVTMATVGYGDILPISGFARFMVSVEILTGVAYGVFFLSVIATFLRER